MICKKCGSEIPDGSLFCTECGTKVEETPVTNTEEVFGTVPAAPVAPEVVPEAPVAPTVTPAAPQQPRPVQAAPAPTASAATKVVKTGAFFWLDVLFCIPIIGLVAFIIIAASAKNDNIRHLASAKLIEVLVGIILAIGIVILCVMALRSVGLSLQDYMNSIQNIGIY